MINQKNKNRRVQPIEPAHKSEDLIQLFQEENGRDHVINPRSRSIEPLNPLTEKHLEKKCKQDDGANSKIISEANQTEWLVLAEITIHLVPRLNNHTILEEQAACLRQWIPEICGKYGWELGQLSIRSDYVSWTLYDFPEILLPDMLQIIREKTSSRLFKQFPSLSVENPDHGYWSSGCLVNSLDRDTSTHSFIRRESN